MVPVGLRQVLRLRYLRAPISPALLRSCPDAKVVYSHILFPLLPSDFRIPIVWGSQGLVPDYYAYFGKHRLEDAIYTFRMLGSQADALHVWTRYGAENIRIHCPGLETTVRIIPPFVSIGPLSDLTLKRQDTVRLLFVGREAERKGLFDVIRAFEILALKYKHIELIVVSKVRPSLRARLCRLPRTRYYEGITTAQLHQLMEEASLLIVPTYADAYNLVLVEGMAKGCAIITSNLGALREVAPDGEVGFLVHPGNVEEVVEKAAILIEQEEVRLRMAEAGIRRHQMYHSEAAVLPKLYELFREVAD